MKTENERLIELGINPIFPGESETKIAFTRPKIRQNFSPFIINPQPSLKHFDRPFASAKIEPRYTEYQIKFRMPDGRKINTYGFGAFEAAVPSDNVLFPYTGFYVAYERKQFFPKMTAKELAKAAKLTTDKTVIDLGSAESGEIFNTQFTFTNTGKSDLKLHEITPQCPCVKVDYPKNTLKPGESMVVKMRFDTGIKQGKSTQTISIISNDPAQPERNIYLVAHLPERDKPKCATCPR